MTSEELRDCYVKHRRRLYFVALAITLDRQTAEDAVHNALVHLLAKNHRPDNLSAYVMRAVRNAAIDIARSRRWDEPMQQEFLVGTDEVLSTMSPRMLTKAFRKLRRAERETIVLHLYAGMTFQEIADLRCRSINTVSAWYRRGLVKLRTVLEVNHE